MKTKRKKGWKTKVRKPVQRTVRRVSVRQKVLKKKIQKPILEPVGKVTHYFPKVKAGVVKVTKGVLAIGDTIHVKGHTTDFKQRVTSLQLDHQPIQKALKGQEVGLRVKSRVRQRDLVYIL